MLLLLEVHSTSVRNQVKVAFHPPRGAQAGTSGLSNEAVQQDVDGWSHGESFKERCLFSHGTSLSTCMFILRYMLRIHRCSSNRARTLTHSLDKLQPASFLSCFTASRLFCSSTYDGAPADTSVSGFYLWAQASLCARLPNTNQRHAPSSTSQEPSSAVFTMCTKAQKPALGTRFKQLQTPKTNPDAFANLFAVLQ